MHPKNTINFIAENYPTKGKDWCSEKTGLTKKQVTDICYNYKIRLKNKPIYIKRELDYKQFTSNFTKESAYILGILWGDGNLGTTPSRIYLTSTVDDYEDIESVFLKTGNWGKTIRIRKHWKPSVTVYNTSKIVYDFLLSNNYKTKYRSALPIIQNLPDSLMPYWYRGLSDADGCFYIRDHVCQYSISGPYTQEWDFVESLFTKLDVKKYKVSRTISRKGHSNSRIRTTNRTDILKFADYIYQNFEKDNIGLKRKYLLYKKIKYSS